MIVSYPHETRKTQFFVGCLLCLLDEGMNDYDALADDKAVERSAYPKFCTRAKLKEPAAEGARVRQAQVGTMFRK